MSQIIQLKPNQAKEIVKEFIARNKVLQSKGQMPLAMSITGESGLGKTSVVLQAAEEEGLPCAKINLAMLDDLGDLVGFPLKSYEMSKGDKTGWFNDKQFDVMIKAGYDPTGEVKTEIAPPAWVKVLKDGGILLLDDYNRADQRFMNATMEMVDRQSYYGWDLPKGVTIIMSCNPSDGEYFTAQQDQAQSTRYFNFGFKFDIDSWTTQAQKEGVDHRMQVFMMKYYKEALFGTGSKKKSSKLITNPRQWGKFFSLIQDYPDYEKALPKIQLLGKGIVGDNINFFTTFIQQRLDKLVDPVTIMNTKMPTVTVIAEIEASIGKGKKYAAEIASIVATRLSTYLIHHLENNNLSDDDCQRLEDVCKSKVFGEDLNFKIFRDTFNEHQTKFGKLLTRPYFLKHITGAK